MLLAVTAPAATRYQNMQTSEDEYLSEEASAAFHGVEEALERFEKVSQHQELTAAQKQMKGEFDVIYHVAAQRLSDGCGDNIFIPLMTGANRILITLNQDLIDQTVSSFEIPDFPQS